MRKRFIGSALAGAIALSMLPGIAAAQAAAITNTPVNVYAGPAEDYPVVAQVPDGVQIGVNGCVEGYTWCDVEAPGLRGWVYGGYLSYPYDGNEVPIMGYGPSIGLPIIGFSLGAYWGNNYRDRPWYHDEGRWQNHAPPPHGPPPGYRPGPGPGPGPGFGPGRGEPPPGRGGPPPQEYRGGPGPGQGPGQQQYRGGPAPTPQHGGPGPAAQQFHGGPAPQEQRGGPPQGRPAPQQQQRGGEPKREENGGNH